MQDQEKKLLSQNYRGSCSFLFVNGIKVYQFKVKGSEIKPYLFCLRNTSDEFKSITWKKKNGLWDMYTNFMMIVILLVLGIM